MNRFNERNGSDQKVAGLFSQKNCNLDIYFQSRRRPFYIFVVVQRRLSNVQKSMMHVQRCCFASLNLLLFCRSRFRLRPGGVRHDPQRFMGKKVTVPHFNRDTVEFASRKRDESNPGIKTLLPFLKNITEESDMENLQDLIVALYA